MLIRCEDGDLIVVRQTDHMAQVARIAEAWGNARYPAPEHREETIRAAALHDNGWRDWEEQPTLVPETGRPRNLGEVQTPVHAAFYAAGVERAAAIDPYAGLLVSLHATALYTGVRGWDTSTLTPLTPADLDAVGRSFVARQCAVQGQLRTALAASSRFGAAVEPARLRSAYLRLRAWDQLSLYFVFQGMGDGRLDHVPAAEGESSITLRQIGPYAATAHPWPFAHDRVDAPVVVTRAPDRRYGSGAEFLATLTAATPQVITYTLTP